ncbi:MAG: hypothetical protein KAG28_06500 [Cocleimonas sp.]|nr:hypothetical protein [Cocleimonas sp.]
MSFLSLLTNSSATSYSPKQRKVEPICEEYAELYEDDDFLEILKMSSEEVKSKIRSYDENPDEILSRIKGRLDHTVIPLRIEKKEPKVKTEHIINLLHNIVSLKITHDIFHIKKQHQKPDVSEKIKQAFSRKKLFLIGGVPTALLASTFSIISINNSFMISSNPSENKITLTAVLPAIKQNEEKNKKQPIKIASSIIMPKNISSDEEYNSSMKKIIERYLINNDSQYANIMKNNNVSALIGIRSNDFKQSNKVINVAIHDIKKYQTSIKIINIKKNDSYSSLKKIHKFHIKDWKGIKELPQLISGNKLALITQDNTLTSVGYINKSGLMKEIALYEKGIKELGEKKYYKDAMFDLNGFIKEDQNLYKLIYDSPEFKDNKKMANIIAEKLRAFMSQKETPIQFNKIEIGSGFTFSVAIGRDQKTDHIIYIGKVKQANIRLHVASNR